MGSSQRSKKKRKRTRRSKSLVKYYGSKTLSNCCDQLQTVHVVCSTSGQHNLHVPPSSGQEINNECEYSIDTSPLPSPSNDPESSTEVDLDAGWGSQEEYESILHHQLAIEVGKKEDSIITGNRIVNLAFMLDWSLRLQVEHSRICTCGRLHLWKDIKNGFFSKLYLKCTVCNRIIMKETHDSSSILNLPIQKNKEYAVNIGAVWGTLSTGSCYSHLEELCSLIDVPVMDYKKFHRIEEDLGDCWHDDMIQEFDDAGKEEARIARASGNVDLDGIPFITVYLDEGWSKRSYGHNYNAASGSAVIIGKATKKVLFMGVRNKFCYVCALAYNKQKKANEHRCYRNWKGSSSSMESHIIVEGFNKSIAMHGIRYKYFIADGDSVHLQI